MIQSVIVAGRGFFRDGVIVAALKHMGTTAWLSEMLKTSVRTSLSFSAQSFCTQPDMLSGPSALGSSVALFNCWLLKTPEGFSEALDCPGTVFALQLLHF